MRKTVSKLILLGMTAMLLLLAQPVSSQDDTPIVDLGPPTGWALPSEINSQGQVVGSWDHSGGSGTAHFLWTSETGWQELLRPGFANTYINDLRQVASNSYVVENEQPNTAKVQAILYDGREETTLGDLGGWKALPCDINEQGQVAGDSFTDENEWHAFLWTPTAGIQDLGTLGGNRSSTSAMNDSQWIVGHSVTLDGDTHAFLWTPASDEMSDLGTLGGSYSRAHDVNNAGQVVGTSTTPDGVDHAFLWTARGGMIDLGTLGGSTSAAFDISEIGHVVGWSDIAGDAERHAFLWTASGGMQDLGALSGGTSRAKRVSDLGQVVGYSTLDTGYTHAFTWTPGTGMIDLGTLPGGQGSDAIDVNELGQVVGWSYTATPGERRVVLWTTLSPAQRIQGVINRVAGLVDDGVLAKGNSNGLIQKLENASRLLDAGNTGAACNQLEAFINQVEAFAKSGRLPADVAAELTETAEEIAAQLCG
jgi:probable HAF family extracellular repeat protein